VTYTDIRTDKQMANIIPKTVKETVMGSKDAKIKQLEANIQEPTKDSRITSDYGVKQSNTDDWLRVNSNDQIGPSLLEDNFGREKVCQLLIKNSVDNVSFVIEG
jgi:catalase